MTDQDKEPGERALAAADEVTQIVQDPRYPPRVTRWMVAVRIQQEIDKADGIDLIRAVVRARIDEREAKAVPDKAVRAPRFVQGRRSFEGKR